MLRPNVKITAMNGGLALIAPAAYGTSAILVASPIAPVAGYGVPFLVKNKKQVSTAFVQAGNEAVITAINDGFFAEAPEGTALWILASAPATTMTAMLAFAIADLLMNAGGGDIRFLGVVKFPGGAYAPTVTTGFDDEVFTAVTAAQALADRWFGKKQPFRIFIEGFAFDGIAATAKDYKAEVDKNVAISPFNINGSTAQATLLALGRRARIESQQSIGRVKTGSLNIAEAAVVKIGTTVADDYDTDDLDSLWEKRYITIEPNRTAPGYVFSDDNTLCDPTDDYSQLRNGAVMDNIVRLAFDTYYQEVNDDVDVDENGRLSAAVEKALETAVETSIDNAIRSQLSKKKDGTADVRCLVNPDPIQYAALYEANGISNPNFNLLQTSNVYLFVMAKPKGCLKYLNVYVGFTS
ncbi:MAG: hypothetical protein KGM16_17840 [Bacteroidota bacterium]|nr:hypothetical protein [Bacteroidota bacterium]